MSDSGLQSFEELKRYARFDQEDEAALRALAPHAIPHFERLVAEFYERLSEHETARKVLASVEQLERLKVSLRDWLSLLLSGPWNGAYFERRLRIGKTHVRVGLEERYMFGAMNLIRVSLTKIAHSSF